MAMKRLIWGHWNFIIGRAKWKWTEDNSIGTFGYSVTYKVQFSLYWFFTYCFFSVQEIVECMDPVWNSKVIGLMNDSEHQQQRTASSTAMRW